MRENRFVVTHGKSEKHNPVAYWQVGRSAISGTDCAMAHLSFRLARPAERACDRPLNAAFAFSIDCKHLATVGRDGFLRIFNFDAAQYVLLQATSRTAPLEPHRVA